jgi:hypothetical protein
VESVEDECEVALPGVGSVGAGAAEQACVGHEDEDDIRVAEVVSQYTLSLGGGDEGVEPGECLGPESFDVWCGREGGDEEVGQAAVAGL